MKILNGNDLKIKHLWQLIRGENLIFIVLIQYFFKYLILDFQISENMVIFSQSSHFSIRLMFLLMVMSTVFIAAAGYIINDISDINADKINKPGKNIVGIFMPLKMAKTLYFSLNIFGVLTGLISFILLGNPFLISIQLLMIILLYLYATEYQCKGIWGNIIVAFSSAMAVLIVWLFEFYALISAKSNYLLNDNLSISLIVGYAGFAFVFTLLREWAKDLQDLEGDIAVGCQNMMVKKGEQKGKKFLSFAIVLSSVLIVVWQMVLFSNTDSHHLFIFIFFVLQIFIYVHLFPKIINSKGKTDYRKLSSLLKLIMANAIFYMLFFRF